jgi:hypothetical protein
MFVYRSRFLTRGEVWFDERPDGTRVDWIYHRQRSAPLAGCRWRHFYTLLTDLRQGSGELFLGIEDRTRQKIAEAQEKDGLRCERLDSKGSRVMDRLEAMWNEFARAQHTALFEREWLEQISAAGKLDVCAALDPAGTVLGYHLVFLAPKRARQLFAISPYKAVPDVAWRGAVSRANCFIHWQNFVAFKAQGIPFFDFGGWYTGTTNIQFLGMNRFKKSFGGHVVREYDCEQPVTLKGWLLLTAARIWDRIKQVRMFDRARSGRPERATQPNEGHMSPAF